MREVLLGVAVGFLVAWLYHAFAVPMAGVPSFPIISYNPGTGAAQDWKRVPFTWVNPGR